MRSQNYVLKCLQGRTFERLSLEHIQRCAGQLALLQRLHQVSLANQFASRAVHQPRSTLHFADGLSIDHAGGLRRQAHVQTEVVALCIEVFEFYHADPVLFGDRRRNKGIMRHQFHPYGACAPCNFHADAAQAEHSQSLAAEFAALQ